MLQNYIKIALRNLFRNKLYSLINVFGLAIGMLVCMLIFIFVNHEMSFDDFHEKSSKIYRLNEVQTFGNVSPQKVALSMPMMGETMVDEFPEVENFTRYYSWGKLLCEYEGRDVVIENNVAVDSTFFDVFDFEWLEGDKENALNRPDCIVLTESVAKSFFGDENPIGKSFSDEDDDISTVTGVIADVPENSHLQFDALYSMISVTGDTSNQWMRRWGSNFLNTYLLVNPEADIEAMEKRFPDYITRHMSEEANEAYELYLQPLEDVHLASTDVTHDYNNYKKFDRKYVQLFILLAIFVLAIGSINFMNLSTARSLQRAKEVGVRKTIGASKSQLIGQFMWESVLLSLCAIFIAIFLGEFLISGLNAIADRNLELSIYKKPSLLAITLGGSILVGLVSGILPAMLLSAINPLQAIRQRVQKMAGRKFNYRSALVTLQFAIAIGLIVSTFIVLKQYDYLTNMDTGFDREQVMLIEMNRNVNDKYDSFRDRLLSNPNIIDVTASGQRLGNNLHQTSCRFETPNGIEDNSSSRVLVDYNFLEFYGIEMTHGRWFSKDMPTDQTKGYIVNEVLAKDMGWDDPVGKKFSFGGAPDDDMGVVIGVAKNFKYNSLHHEVEPLFMVWRDWGFSEASIRLTTENVGDAIAHVENEWDQITNGRPFEYEFLDDHFNKLYHSEKQVSQVVSLLAFFSIFVACLGLFGLATITTEQRIKEIGIRKVLGASTVSIVNLLSKDFLKLVLLAIIVATPVAHYFMDTWLQDFAFRINIHWWYFALAGFIALSIAYLTMSFQSIKAALTNPVKSLRSE